MAAVPGEQEIYSVDRRNSDVQGVPGSLIRQISTLEEMLPQNHTLRSYIETWDSLRYGEPLSSRLNIPLPYLFENHLGYVEVV